MDKVTADQSSIKTERLNQLSKNVIGAAIAVHKALGPGLLESAYEECLYYELTERGLKVAQQVPLPLVYGNVKLDCGYRLDLMVENDLVIEIKSVDSLLPVHKAREHWDC